MNNTWYDVFMERLHQKFSKNTELTEALMDLLSIEREAAYRRLRKDVRFPVEEIVKIALAWKISLDDIVGLPPHQFRFNMHLLDYRNPSDEDLHLMEVIVQMIDAIKDFPDSEYMEICNKLPRMLISGFPHLNRISLGRWIYQYTDEDAIPFSKVLYAPKVAEYSAQFYSKSKDIASVNFIWDSRIFDYLVDEINYFYSIYLITDEEKKLIKKELYDFLDYMLQLTSKGCWPETGNKLNLYISQINVDTNYNCYWYDGKTQLCCITVFGKNELYSTNPNIAENFRNWIQSKKRSSVLISGTDEKHRIEFFKKQKQLIDEL
jgi:uncharacterized protein YodC (DUF2158 family)